MLWIKYHELKRVAVSFWDMIVNRFFVLTRHQEYLINYSNLSPKRTVQ